jgi:hypothetical protein
MNPPLPPPHTHGAHKMKRPVTPTPTRPHTHTITYLVLQALLLVHRALLRLVAREQGLELVLDDAHLLLHLGQARLGVGVLLLIWVSGAEGYVCVCVWW